MFLGIDLGTSEVKLLLLDDAGQIAALASAPLGVSRPLPLWAEQAPQDWWHATEHATAQLRSAHAAAWSQIRGIGLSGQMHGAVLLDANDEVLRPAILWNDGRSHLECETLTRRAPQLHAVAGNLAMPGFTAPKLLWVQQHEPEVFAKTRTVLLPKDYLRLRLSGEKVTDPSDAAGTLWLDVATRDWSDALLDACQLSRTHVPRVVESNAASAVLLPSVADAWGLRRDVVIAAGASDNAASAIGIGAVSPGDGFVSLGTSGVLFLVDDCFRPNPESAVHAFCHALPKRWHQMSVMLSAASCFKWHAQVSGGADETTLLAELAATPDGMLAGAPLFLPYLAGERTPHNDPFAQGVLFALNHNTTRALCTYAVLEGVAFGLADGLAALQASGAQVTRLSLMGGGARSPWWAQLIADTLNVEILLHPDGAAGAALGAARLGWMAVGGNESRVCTKPSITARVQPNPQRHSLLQPRLQRFRTLYRQLKPMTAQV